MSDRSDPEMVRIKCFPGVVELEKKELGPACVTKSEEGGKDERGITASGIRHHTRGSSHFTFFLIIRFPVTSVTTIRP